MTLAVLAIAVGCKNPADWSREADHAAEDIIARTQEAAFGRAERFTIERPSETLRRYLLISQGLPVRSHESLGPEELAEIDHWPTEEDRLGGRADPDPNIRGSDLALVLRLVDALSIAAYNSREYQTEKEGVFRQALALSEADHAFHTQLMSQLAATLDSTLATEPDRSRTTSLVGTPSISADRVFQNGVTLSSRLGVDIAKLLTPPRARSSSVFADLSISIPLMRGAGRHIVAEPLIQSQRDTLYAILRFERFKRTFAVQIATEFVNVLQQLDRVQNAEQNYKSLLASVRQLRRLADAGRRPELEVDQAVQNELQSRDRWIREIQAYKGQIDSFRVTLGLPPDSDVTLDREELVRLGDMVRRSLASNPPGSDGGVTTGMAVGTADDPVVLTPPGRGTPGPFEIDEGRAIDLALANRLDLFIAEGAIYDAQRTVVVAADALNAEVTLFGSGEFGERRSGASATLPDVSELRTNAAAYRAMLTIDLPLERTRERNVYRNSWIQLEQAVRDLADLEDTVKIQIRDRLRTLLQAREGQRIQAAAVTLAQRRVDSARLFLDAGRAQTRDLLEAQEDLVSAQNDLTAALIDYRIAELELQRDMGLLRVDSEGQWMEFDPMQVAP